MQVAPGKASSSSKAGSSVNKLVQALHRTIQAEMNGQLTIKLTDGTTWTLYFRVGRLFWATGGRHRFRRWYRLLKQFSPDLPESATQVRERLIAPLWEHWLLNIMIKRQQIVRAEVKQIIEANILEVLVDILHSAPMIKSMTPSGEALPAQDEPIAILSTTDLLSRAQAQVRAWYEQGLMPYSPSLAPRILDRQKLLEQAPAQIGSVLNNVVTGRSTIREIALVTKQDPLKIGRLLLPYIQLGLIDFKIVPDARNPFEGRIGPSDVEMTDGRSSGEEVSGEKGDQPLLLCVDDSAQIGHILEAILKPTGLRFMSLQDPVDALSFILKNKPSLIFLDLIMPLVYGNEICTQLRRSPEFRNTPVIMLSSNSRMLDRLQARGAGATDFIAKPLDPEKVIKMVQRYLQSGHEAV